MNHYAPYELANAENLPTGKFHFTVENNNHVRPVGRCQETLGTSEACNHNSAVEASDCYRAFCKEKGLWPGGFPWKKEDEKGFGTELFFSSSY